jgi:glucan phosphorylase
MDKLKVARFNGQDYHVWKHVLQLHFEGHKLWPVVSGATPRPPLAADGAAEKEEKAAREAQAKWDEKDTLARCAIVNSMESAEIKKIMGCRSSEEVWKRLETVYEQKNATSVQTLLAQFFELRMDASDSVAAHVAHVESMASRLADLGHKQEDASAAHIASVLPGGAGGLGFR